MARSEIVRIVARMHGDYRGPIRLAVHFKRAFCSPDESPLPTLHTMGGRQDNIRCNQRSRASVVDDSYSVVVACGSTVHDSCLGPGMVRPFQLSSVVTVYCGDDLSTDVVHGDRDGRQDSPNLQRLGGIPHS